MSWPFFMTMFKNKEHWGGDVVHFFVFFIYNWKENSSIWILIPFKRFVQKLDEHLQEMKHRFGEQKTTLYETESEIE